MGVWVIIFGHVTCQEVSDDISALCVEFDRLHDPDGAHRVAQPYLGTGNARRRDLLSVATHHNCIAHFPDLFVELMGHAFALLCSIRNEGEHWDIKLKTRTTPMITSPPLTRLVA